MHMRILAIGMVVALLSACDSATPKCNSSEAKNLVTDIAQKEIKKQFEQLKNSQMSGMVPKNTDSLMLKVINIRTIKHDPSLDVYQCAATLEMTMQDETLNLPKTNELPITYNIQKTDDNNGQFYINVLGL
ncbi:hypothetical protein [Serratia fonticola]|uniref:Lipoprotein n=1 Tax=Serratia fonticola TaxID=47917 RepID=A0AAW3WPG1_SERFO|nr:hypothetical protein [Serratia fonticola]MBC3212422.1 hypothetical protein [Serratia fonticola]NYA12959.1 hypothetical protein [Serratia fonticola]NYA32538.1 hypothetical protein [Serratia fonticola]